MAEEEWQREDRRRRSGGGGPAEEDWRRRIGGGGLAVEEWQRRAGRGSFPGGQGRRMAKVVGSVRGATLLEEVKLVGQDRGLRSRGGRGGRSPQVLVEGRRVR